MTYVYIASAAADIDFARRLSTELEKASIKHWYDDGQTIEEVAYSHMQKASHMVLLLSPTILLDEKVLGALEYAKQQKLERIVMRVAPIEVLPPQIQGILPLDASNDVAYQEAIQTLLDDLIADPPPPRPELPQVIVAALNDENPIERRIAVEALARYRNEEPALKELARDELNALMFREKDGGLRSLVRATLQTFDAEEEDAAQEKITLPSKEDLMVQAGDNAFVVEDKPVPAQYLWHSNRWRPLLGALAVGLGLLLWVATGQIIYLIAIALVGVVLPHLNIVIRKDGEFEWAARPAIIGNTILGIVLAGLVALIAYVAMEDLEPVAAGVCILVGGGYSWLVGWLSTLRIENTTD